MKPIDVNSITCIDFEVENNIKNPKFKVDHHVKISRYQSIFRKNCIPNMSEEAFVIKHVKSTVPWI